MGKRSFSGSERALPGFLCEEALAEAGISGRTGFVPFVLEEDFPEGRLNERIWCGDRGPNSHHNP